MKSAASGMGTGLVRQRLRGGQSRAVLTLDTAGRARSYYKQDLSLILSVRRPKLLPAARHLRAGATLRQLPASHGERGGYRAEPSRTPRWRCPHAARAGRRLAGDRFYQPEGRQSRAPVCSGYWVCAACTNSTGSISRRPPRFRCPGTVRRHEFLRSWPNERIENSA